MRERSSGQERSCPWSDFPEEARSWLRFRRQSNSSRVGQGVPGACPLLVSGLCVALPKKCEFPHQGRAPAFLGLLHNGAKHVMLLKTSDPQVISKRNAYVLLWEH